MDNSIVIDWVSISGLFYSFSEMFDFLGITESYIADKFQSCSPINMYDVGLSYRSQGANAIGFYLGQSCNPEIDENMRGRYGFINMSGRGCRLFETYSCLTFNDLFELVLNTEGFNCTRIDIALDIRDKEYPISRFVNAYHKGYYVSSARTSSHIHSVDAHGNIGTSLYFGKLDSDFRINIYDKRAERGFNERELPDGWIRIEVRLRHQTAMVFLERFVNGIPIGHLYFGVLTDKLRFVKYNKNDRNKHRWETVKWWSKLIQDNQKVHLELPGITYDIGRWERNFWKQCGSRLLMATRLFPNPFQFYAQIKSDKSIKLNSDQRFLLDNYVPDLEWYEL